MPQINLEEGTKLEYALKEFRRMVRNAGIFDELRKRRHYRKPSVAKKEKAIAARNRKHRAIKRARRENEY